MESNPYVNIKTFFNNDNPRDYEALIKVYHDSSLIFSAIKDLLNNKIDFNNKRVLLKPNWVLHKRRTTDEYALFTHSSIILGLVSFIVKFYKPEKITIGDAPLQDCIWDKLIETEFLNTLTRISKDHNVPIYIKDFRRVSLNFEKNQLIENKSPITDYLIFDVGNASALEPITNENTKFRVTNYDPARMKEAHGIGIHKYCIRKEFFEHDVIITIPKIKTHQKAGITGALKILVGINGDKDYLPHHRKGGDLMGGDCYPGKNSLKYLTESFLDVLNKYRGKPLYETLRTGAFAFWKFILLTPTNYLGAAWHGNDTCWRMVADLNEIALKGNSQGLIQKENQREIYSLSDGIIGGQGNGPLNPQPLNLGLMMFSNHSLMNDLVISKIMKFDSKKIPLIRDISKETVKSCQLTLNGIPWDFQQLNEISIQTLPAPGWELLA